MINDIKLGFKLDWDYERTHIASQVNGFFYFLRRIPIVGKLIPIKIFQLYGLKLGIFFLLLITTVIFEFLKKILIFGVLFVAFFLARTFFNSNDNIMDSTVLSIIIGSWILFECFLEQVFSPTWYYLKKKEINFIRFFSLSARDFIFGRAASDVFKNLLFYSPILVVLAIVKGSLWVFIGCISAYFAGYFVGQSLIQSAYTLFFSTKKRRFLVVIPVFLATIALFLYLTLSHPEVYSALWSPIACFFYIVVGYFSLKKSSNFQNEDNYTIFLLEKSDRNISAVAQTTATNEYKTLGQSMQKNLAVTDSSQFSSLTGSHYLNALLFERYRKVLVKSLVFRMVGIAIVGVAINVAIYMVDLPNDQIQKLFYMLLPISFFILYILGMGKNIVSMVFMNCDKAMLYYPYYRESNVIVTGFMTRFKKSFFYNGLIALEVFLFIVILYFIKGEILGIKYLGAALLLYISLAFLFSFHELFVYYILQPFTVDMTIKSPLYSIVNVLMWMVAYANINFPITEFYYSIVVSIASLVYVGIGLIVIIKFSPRTFKIREE